MNREPKALFMYFNRSTFLFVNFTDSVEAFVKNHIFSCYAMDHCTIKYTMHTMCCYEMNDEVYIFVLYELSNKPLELLPFHHFTASFRSFGVAVSLYLSSRANYGLNSLDNRLRFKLVELRQGKGPM